MKLSLDMTPGIENMLLDLVELLLINQLNSKSKGYF